MSLWEPVLWSWFCLWLNCPSIAQVCFKQKVLQPFSQLQSAWQHRAAKWFILKEMLQKHLSLSAMKLDTDLWIFMCHVFVWLLRKQKKCCLSDIHIYVLYNPQSTYLLWEICDQINPSTVSLHYSATLRNGWCSIICKYRDCFKRFNC